ncbi:hypothetical protein TNCV_1614021 [Trichonephila clavipes]|nr:hypothetical protein TNCV_1614021 [Trichonephila clavipes]
MSSISFGNDSKMTKMSVNVIIEISPRVTKPNKDRFLAVTPNAADGIKHPTCLVSYLQPQMHTIALKRFYRSRLEVEINAMGLMVIAYYTVDPFLQTKRRHECKQILDGKPRLFFPSNKPRSNARLWEKQRHLGQQAGGIIGPYYFKNDEGHNVTVNGDRYRAMITNFFIPELNNHDVQELWFQQDGATCHTARATIDLLKDTFGDRLISRFGPVNWPPRSCDLTPLDYFLWGYVKSLVYADKP